MVEIRITKKIDEIGLLAKFAYVLGGVLLSTSVLAVSSRIIPPYGMGLGLVVCLILTYLGFSHTKTGARLRYVTWGLIGMTIFSIIAVTTFFITISNIEI